MTDVGYPSVFTVDTHDNRPPVPTRLRERRQRSGAAQTLLFLLVSLALCGMVIEGYFIYHLSKSQSASTASSSMQMADRDVIIPTKRPREVLPSKPVAHLTDGKDVNHKHQVMAWSTAATPLLYGMDYKDRRLIIHKEGYYYVYTKVSFFNLQPFNHSVQLTTNRYKGKSIPILMSRANPDILREKDASDRRSNSYLGGVFHFYEDDALFVKVSSTSQIARYKYYENVFGAYMI